MMIGRGKGISRGRESEARTVKPLPSVKNHDVTRNFSTCHDSSADSVVRGIAVARCVCILRVLTNFYDRGLSNS